MTPLMGISVYSDSRQADGIGITENPLIAFRTHVNTWPARVTCFVKSNRASDTHSGLIGKLFTTLLKSRDTAMILEAMHDEAAHFMIRERALRILFTKYSCIARMCPGFDGIRPTSMMLSP